MTDEGPSSEDLDRFGGDTAYCPDCGAEIWDQAEVCPACGSPIGGRTSLRPPVQEWFRRRWILLVAVIAAAALLLAILGLF